MSDDLVVSQLVVPAVSVNALAATGTGSSVNAGGFTQNVAFLLYCGSSVSGVVHFEASWDNTNWVTVGSTGTSFNSSGLLSTFNKPAQFFRAVIDNFTGVGGQSVTVLVLPY